VRGVVRVGCTLISAAQYVSTELCVEAGHTVCVVKRVLSALRAVWSA